MSLPTPAVGWQHRLPNTRPPSYFHTPAYNAVPARNTLTLASHETGGGYQQYANMPNTTPPQDPPAPGPPPKRIEWSAAVRDYVRRSFGPPGGTGGITKDQLEQKLKELLKHYAERDELDRVDWANHRLAHELVLEDRKKAEAARDTRATGNNGWINKTASLHLSPNGSSTNVHDAHFSDKKRKASDDRHSEDSASPPPPWKRNDRKVFEDRLSRPGKAGGEKRRKKHETVLGDLDIHANQADLERRKQRFQASTTVPTSSDMENVPTGGTVIGTCQKIEKSYLRLTAPPKPETVRPLDVLKKAFGRLKEKWCQEGDYGYVCDQLKAIRQDLTVQRIKNEFTVNVYEFHARIALEKEDLGEYNGCQSQLRELYKLQLGGHPYEFLAYRILYFVYTRNQIGMNELLAELTPADKANVAVKHALEVRSSLALGNYHKFFRLYMTAPNMGAYLMDKFIVRERLTALHYMAKT
jgi:SAC3 family protein LENG8/THP3